MVDISIYLNIYIHIYYNSFLYWKPNSFYIVTHSTIHVSAHSCLQQSNVIDHSCVHQACFFHHYHECLSIFIQFTCVAGGEINQRFVNLKCCCDEKLTELDKP